VADGDGQGSAADAGQTAAADGPNMRSAGSRLRPRQTNQVGIYFICLAALTFYILIATWPVLDPNDKTGSTFQVPHLFGFYNLRATADSRLFITIMAAGALGSLVHCITSFADYVGDRSLKQSWVWYLILRTPVGIALALVVYLVLRGGLIAPTLPDGGSNGHTATVLNPYGLAAVSAMAGMFSKQATDKLAEVFDSLFRTTKPVTRADPLNPAPPVISSTDPPRLKLGVVTPLAIIGRNFNKDCSASINGKQRDVKWESDTRLTVTLLPEDVAAPTELQLIVRNPTAAGGGSAPLPVSVVATS
jgi:IPT/TIG domain